MKSENPGQVNPEHNGNQSKEKQAIAPVTFSQLIKLIDVHLKDIYRAERALGSALPGMIKNASSLQLVNALEHHLSQTEKQLVRMEQVFELIDKKAKSKKDDAKEGLFIFNETQDKISTDAKDTIYNEDVNSSKQIVDHYETDSYGSMCAFSKTMGVKEDEKGLLYSVLALVSRSNNQ